MSQSFKNNKRQMEAQTNQPETDTVATKFGELKISKHVAPVGFSITLTTQGKHKSRYNAELGEVEPGGMEDFLESITVAGAPLLFVCQNQAQAEIMDALKHLCTGTHPSYVLSKLKGIPV